MQKPTGWMTPSGFLSPKTRVNHHIYLQCSTCQWEGKGKAQIVGSEMWNVESVIA